MTNTTRTDIVFYGLLADAGELSRESAALLLVDATCHRLNLVQARQAIDTWQGYQTTHRPAPAARRAFLARLFTRNRPTTNREETNR